MSILDFISDYFKESPSAAGALMNGGGPTGPLDILPSGYNLDPGMSGAMSQGGGAGSLKDQLLAMMKDELPSKEGDTQRSIGRALVGLGHGIGKADPEGGALGQIGGGITGAADAYGSSEDEDKAKRAAGAKTLFQTLLNQDKVDLQGQIASDKLSQAEDKLRWAQDKEGWMRDFRTRGQDYRETSGDRRLDQGDTRLDQGQQRIDQMGQRLGMDREKFVEQQRHAGVTEEMANKQYDLNVLKHNDDVNYKNRQMEERIGQFDEKQGLAWTKFYETADKNGFTKEQALREFDRKLAKDAQMAKNQDESRSIRERGLAQAMEIKKRFGSGADPRKLYLEARKAVSNRQLADRDYITKNLDPTADAEKIARIQRDSEDFATGLLGAFQNPDTAAGPAYPAPAPGKPSPGPVPPQGAPVLAPGGKVDVRQQIAAARAKGIPDAAIKKRLEDAGVPWPAGM
jgi:hypothetical protein